MEPYSELTLLPASAGLQGGFGDKRTVVNLWNTQLLMIVRKLLQNRVLCLKCTNITDSTRTGKDKTLFDKHVAATHI